MNAIEARAENCRSIPNWMRSRHASQLVMDRRRVKSRGPPRGGEDAHLLADALAAAARFAPPAAEPAMLHTVTGRWADDAC